MSGAQHKTTGIQIILLCVLLVSFYRPSPKSAGYADAVAPPTGLYHCWTGGFDHLAAGTLRLAAKGRYESYRTKGGGSYSFSPDGSVLEFLDGDYHYWEYRGVYQPTHEMQAAKRQAAQGGAVLTNTVQTNPTLPDLPGERIVLMPLGATDAIGTERPGQYQYCYREDGTAGLSAR
jgi:hypothetical protein